VGGGVNGLLEDLQYVRDRLTRGASCDGVLVLLREGGTIMTLALVVIDEVGSRRFTRFK